MPVGVVYQFTLSGVNLPMRDPLELLLVYLGAPVDGEGVSVGEKDPCGSGIHSRRRSLWQQIEAASGSSAMISCFGLSGDTRPACIVH